VFYGVGGEGKTALARHLLGMLEKEYAGRAGLGAVNFEDAAMRRPAEGLLSIRLQLRRTAGLAFPAFDTAFAHWFGRPTRARHPASGHPELFRSESELAGDAYGVGLDVLKDMDGILADTLGEVPGLGLLWKYGNRFPHRFRECRSSGARNSCAASTRSSPTSCSTAYPPSSGADIADAIAACRRASRSRSSATRLRRSIAARGRRAGAFAFRNDRWLRDLVKETPGVLFVLLGRDRLRWAEVEPEWAGGAGPAPARRALGRGRGQFLLDVPVEEAGDPGADGRGAKGLPFYLDLQVDLYESLKNQGRAPEPAQFGGSEPEILGRFLDHLGGDGGPGARRAGALPAVRRGAVAAPRAGVHGRAAAVPFGRVRGVLVRRGAGGRLAQPARADARGVVRADGRGRAGAA
jgi:hypothetical protein